MSVGRSWKRPSALNRFFLQELIREADKTAEQKAVVEGNILFYAVHQSREDLYFLKTRRLQHPVSTGTITFRKQLQDRHLCRVSRTQY